MIFKGYVRKRSKHEPTDSHFYLSRHISKCMMESDALNLDIYPIRTKMTGMQHIPMLRVFCMDKSDSTEFLAEENL